MKKSSRATTARLVSGRTRGSQVSQASDLSSRDQSPGLANASPIQLIDNDGRDNLRVSAARERRLLIPGVPGGSLSPVTEDASSPAEARTTRSQYRSPSRAFSSRPQGQPLHDYIRESSGENAEEWVLEPFIGQRIQSQSSVRRAPFYTEPEERMLLNLVQQHRDSSNRPRWGPIYEAYAQWAEGEAMPQRTRAGLQGKLRLLTTQRAQEPPIVAAPPAVVVLDPDNRELQEEPVVLESEVRVDSDAGTESHADSLTLEPLDPLGLSELMSIAEEATEPIMSAAETATHNIGAETAGVDSIDSDRLEDIFKKKLRMSLRSEKEERKAPVRPSKPYSLTELSWVANKKKCGESRQLRTDIGHCCCLIDRYTVKSKLTKRQVAISRELRQRFKARNQKELQGVAERLKTRLKILSERQRVQLEAAQRKRLRKSQLRYALTGADNDDIPAETVKEFWGGIVGIRKTFDSTDPDLQDWNASMDSMTIDHFPLVWREEVLRNSFEEAVKRAKPFKAPEPDGVQNFWWKKISPAREIIWAWVKDSLNGGALPAYFCRGKVVLLHKGGNRTQPNNFRPIACLNTGYKLTTATIGRWLHKWLVNEKTGVLPIEQRAMIAGTWGTTHAHLIERFIARDAESGKRKRPLSVAWVDYSKAFDSIPHSYVRWVLRRIKTPNEIRSLLHRMMTRLEVRYVGRQNGRQVLSYPLKIESGIPQGCSLSPLLFTLAIAPISHALNKNMPKYISTTGRRGKNVDDYVKINHLFYVDDLKLIAETDRNLNTGLQIVYRVSGAVGLQLNPSKCARVLQNRENTGGDDISPIVESIPTLGEFEEYKYLGIEERLNQNWESVLAIWNSDLTLRQKVLLQNSAVLAKFRYVFINYLMGGGWLDAELKASRDLDTKVRQWLVTAKARYAHSRICRLYLPRREGGFGLRSIEVELLISKIYAYAYVLLQPSLQPLNQLCQRMTRSSKRNLQSDFDKIVSKYKLTIRNSEDGGIVFCENGVPILENPTSSRTLARTIITRIKDTYIQEWRKEWTDGRRTDRGEATRSAEILRLGHVDLEASWYWLKVGHLNTMSVRNIIACQEGCLLTRTHFSNTTRGKTCRYKCWITHPGQVSGCPRWRATLMYQRHDSVARVLHYNYCVKYGLKPIHYTQQIPHLLQNEKVKLWWNEKMDTVNPIEHCVPDLAVFDLVEKTILVIEVTVAWVSGLATAENRKIRKYTINSNLPDDYNGQPTIGPNLMNELKNTHRDWKADFVPVVIGCCGEITTSFVERYEMLGLPLSDKTEIIARMCRSAVLGSDRIIRTHLAREE